MGNLWAGMYVFGLIGPGLVLLGTSIAVVYLARRRRALVADARPAWQFLMLHVVLGIGLSLALGPLAGIAWFVLPGYLFGSLRSPQGAGPPVLSIRHPLTSETARRRHWGLATLFTLTGLLLPWATGLGVKAYLDAHGRPTLSVEGFVDPASLVIELLLTLWAWAFPFVVLASAVVVPWRIGFEADAPERASLLPIWLAYVGGVLAAVPVFVRVFWEFDTLMLLMPVGLLLVPPMAVGYLLGWWRLRRNTV